LHAAHRNVFNLLGVAENSGRNRAAEVDIEANPLAFTVGNREAIAPLVDPTQNLATLFDLCKGRSISGDSATDAGCNKARGRDRS